MRQYYLVLPSYSRVQFTEAKRYQLTIIERWNLEFSFRKNIFWRVVPRRRANGSDSFRNLIIYFANLIELTYRYPARFYHQAIQQSTH